MRKIRVAEATPMEGIVPVNRKGVDPVEGLEILKMRVQDPRGKRPSDRDVQMFDVFEEIAFTHERQEAEFESVMILLRISFVLCEGEYLLVVLP